jgi:hypothetical protein
MNFGFEALVRCNATTNDQTTNDQTTNDQRVRVGDYWILFRAHCQTRLSAALMMASARPLAAAMAMECLRFLAHVNCSAGITALDSNEVFGFRAKSAKCVHGERDEDSVVFRAYLGMDIILLLFTFRQNSLGSDECEIGGDAAGPRVEEDIRSMADAVFVHEAPGLACRCDAVVSHHLYDAIFHSVMSHCVRRVGGLVTFEDVIDRQLFVCVCGAAVAFGVEQRRTCVVW